MNKFEISHADLHNELLLDVSLHIMRLYIMAHVAIRYDWLRFFDSQDELK